jgi:hypothetical protein
MWRVPPEYERQSTSLLQTEITNSRDYQPQDITNTKQVPTKSPVAHKSHKTGVDNPTSG